MASSSALASIECSDQPLDLSFHPSREYLVAAALVDGTLEVHDFRDLVVASGTSASLHQQLDDEYETILSSTPLHTQLLPSQTVSDNGAKQASCRSVLFTRDGRTLWTGGSAGDLAKVDAELVSTFSAKLHPQVITWRSTGKSLPAIQSLFELTKRNLLVTGDEAGGVRLWDPRLCSTMNGSNNGNVKLPQGCVQAWKEHDDYISGIACADDDNVLLVSSADCCLSVYDLRMASQHGNDGKEKNIKKSDDQEDELLSIQIMKHGRKVVCGTGEGVLAVWSWGTFGDVSDRFPGHPQSIDALLKVDEDTLLTGSSDGLIRVVQIQPDKFLGVLGDHEGFPIEKLKFNANQDFVGSVTHDNLIRLWDARILRDDYEDEEDGKEEEQDMKLDAVELAQKRYKSSGQDSDDEWEDMDDDMSGDSDSDSDEDQKPASKNDKRTKHFKTENEKFFEDL